MIYEVKKLLRKKDIFLLTLGGIGDTIDEIRDPLHLVSGSYENMYGFVPKQYRRHNFSLLVGKSLKTGYIERVIKKGKSYLRLTSSGKEHMEREFPITALTKTWNKKWIIVIFDIEEKSRSQRNRLRNILRNIGFGMLQKSVWITPLPIGEDVKELISHQDFSDNSFVLEVSHVLLGDPQALAQRVWGLDGLEEEYLGLKEDMENTLDGIKNNDDRHNKGYNGVERIEGKLQSQKRNQKGKMLEFLMTLPPLPKELFPKNLQEAIST